MRHSGLIGGPNWISIFWDIAICMIHDVLRDIAHFGTWVLNTTLFNIDIKMTIYKQTMAIISINCMQELYLYTF